MVRAALRVRACACVWAISVDPAPPSHLLTLLSHSHPPHPTQTTVMSGYRLAMREAVKYIKNNLLVSADELGDEVLLNACRTSMASKVGGI